ncbi:MAG: hypothetical protein Q8N43_02875 [Candidatus Azambacteria bacterium]|nr:hypothetical protein [Candidatus Azambacteria bacterium]
MHKLIRKLLGKLNIAIALMLAIVMTGGLGGATYVLASSTSSFTQTINAGALGVDIVTSGYVTVGSPTVAMTAATFSFACQTKTGSFGAAEEMIYVTNPDASDTGWAVSVAASAVGSVWDGAVSDFDFNDPTGSGCTDGADTPDTVGGQMTVDASVATLAVGQCSACVVTNVSKGSSAAFSSGVTDTITILTGAAASDDIGDWKLTGVSISQKIPAEQPAASDYDINIVLSIAAS